MKDLVFLLLLASILAVALSLPVYWPYASYAYIPSYGYAYDYVYPAYTAAYSAYYPWFKR